MIKQLNDNLTKEEELELGRIIQEGERAKELLKQSEESTDIIEAIQKGEEAFEKLVGNYINLARKIAHKHHKRTGTRYDIEDLMQDAITALCEAAYTYDPAKNCKLGTHAFYAITKKVSVQINTARLVRLPENKMGEYLQILRAQKVWEDMDEEIQAELVEVEFISEETGLPIEEINLIRLNMMGPASLNAQINDDGNTELGDLIISDDYEVTSGVGSYDDLDENTVEILSKLNEKERDLVAFEFGAFPASMSVEDFMVKYNMDDKDISRETRRAIKKMRKIAGGDK